MFDKLLEEDEKVIELLEEREKRGRAAIVATVIEARFPLFAEEARRKLQRVRRPEELDQLARLAVTAPDENALRWVLDSMVA